MKASSFKTRGTDVVSSLAFVAVISLPLVGGAMGWDLTHDLGEKRQPAKCPILGKDPIDKIPEEFEAFYQDRFGFRNGLIQGHNWIRYKFFKGSSVGQVLFGKDDWLFLARSGMLTDFLGQNPLTPAQLDDWKRVLEQRQHRLGELGIRYLFVIAPNKATVYPEMLPDHIERGRGRSRMDQLLDYLRDRSTVNFIDLRPALLQAKSTGLIYQPRDTHWTDRGAIVAYEQIGGWLGKWFDEIRPVSQDCFEITEGRREPDLSMMLGLGETLAERTEVWVPKTPRMAKPAQAVAEELRAGGATILPERLVVLENPQARRRLVMFHDSFTAIGGLREHLAEHFSRSIFIVGAFDDDVLNSFVEQEHPDVVIEEVVERKIDDDPVRHSANKK